jgi:hypothetical protein
MTSIRPCALPQHALLARYTRSGAYTDCWSADVSRAVSQAEYVETFYTGALFKIERRLLAWAVSTPSTDAQARALASGALSRFSAWKVEDRSAEQLLMCDLSGRTRSWLMVAPQPASTRLYFGSAVVPVRDQASGRSSLGFSFKALLGFHELYSRLLLRAACKRLARAP